MRYWVQGRTEDGLLFWANGHWSPRRGDAFRMSYDDAARVLEDARVANQKAQEISADGQEPATVFTIHQLKIVADELKGKK